MRGRLEAPTALANRRRTIEEDHTVSDLQQQVQEAIDQLVESGAETGLQVSVYRHGEPVVDAVAGVADPSTGRARHAGHPVLLLLDRQGRDRHGGARAGRARRLRLRHPDRRAVAGVRRPRQGERDRPARPDAHGRRARHTGRHHAGGPVRLGQDVRRDRRRRALVGAGHQDRLPRLHVRLHRRRDRAPGHRQADLAGPARGGGRAAGHRRRALLRRAGVRARPGWPGWRTRRAARRCSPRCPTIRRSSSWGRGR